MIRKSQKEFPLTHHKAMARKLTKLDAELREVLAAMPPDFTTTGIAKAKDALAKSQFWLTRSRGALDNTLLRDFPGEYQPSVYFPGAPATPAPVVEPPTIAESANATEASASEPTPAGETPAVEHVVLSER